MSFVSCCHTGLACFARPFVSCKWHLCLCIISLFKRKMEYLESTPRELKYSLLPTPLFLFLFFTFFTLEITHLIAFYVFGIFYVLCIFFKISIILNILNNPVEMCYINKPASPCLTTLVPLTVLPFDLLGKLNMGQFCLNY